MKRADVCNTGNVWAVDLFKDDTAPDRSIPSVQVGAHLRALLENGWTYTRLAAHLGYDRGNLRNIATGRNQWTGALMAEDILSLKVTS